MMNCAEQISRLTVKGLSTGDGSYCSGFFDAVEQATEIASECDKVWIVIGVDAHGSDILGVFDTREKAEECRNRRDLDDSYAFVKIDCERVE